MDLYFNGRWEQGKGEVFHCDDPVSGQRCLSYQFATFGQAETALVGATQGFHCWSEVSFTERKKLIEAFGELLRLNRLDLAETISLETAKPLWESLSEVDAMINKIPISIQAYEERTGDKEETLKNYQLKTSHHPIGICLILGPFNFPGHLPHGQIIPALLAGNSLVFKPSEYTPKTAIQMAKLWENVGLPPGVFNLVLGDQALGRYLSERPSIKGIFFTGSYEAGVSLHRLCAGKIDKLLVLEMGGNNPLIVWSPEDIPIACDLIIQSAYLSAGQRCTAAKRLIIPDTESGEFLLKALVHRLERLQVGDWRQRPEPFMGAVITAKMAERWLNIFSTYQKKGAKVYFPLQLLKPKTGLLSPGLIDITGLETEDTECFGPLLCIQRARDFQDALNIAKATRYGLVAGLISQNRTEYEKFKRAVPAGLLVWNRPTTGASSWAPFGGIKDSGNYRPAGYYMADHCAYPRVSNESATLSLPDPPLIGLMNDR